MLLIFFTSILDTGFSYILLNVGLCNHTLSLSLSQLNISGMTNEAGNLVSDADGIKDIWRKYMEKLLNGENDWDVDVDCPEVMGLCCLISEEEVAAAIKGLNIGKALEINWGSE